MIAYENTKDLYELVQRAGEEHGNLPFLRWEVEGGIHERSYADFVGRCNAFAEWVQGQKKPQGRNLHVGLLGTGTDPYLTALLGTMEAGAVAVPLDMGMSPKELSAELSLADVDVLFFDEALRAKVQDAAKDPILAGLRVLPMADESGHDVEAICRAHAGAMPMRDFEANTPALIVFTSGTTGKRKGVVLSHGNLIDNLFNSEGLFHPEGETYLNVLPLHHIYCIANDVLWVFCYGRPLCLNQDMRKIIEHMQLFQPSIMFVVPAIAKGLYNYVMACTAKMPGLGLKEVKERALSKRLYKLFCGGGALSPELSSGFEKMGVMVAQGYGMSETSPKITYLDWSRPDKFTSVGKLAKRFQLRFVDGEIQVKGPSVMLGYYNGPDETALAFTNDGWLKTGDVGYMDEEGFIYLTGRKKNTIVLSNGENVAPEQVEALFADDRLVADVMVLGKNDLIAAEFYPDKRVAEALGVTDVRAAIARIVEKHNRELPFYMQIKSFEVREEPFPKTTSGKLIRPQFCARQEESAAQQAGAEVQVESRGRHIREAVEAAIGSAGIGEDDNLFEAGLDSLGGIMLLSELEDLGMSVSWDDLVEHPSVSALRELVTSRGGSPQPHPVLERYPLTNMQVFFVHILRGNTTANLPFLIRLKPHVDVERLRKAVADAFDCHPGLKGQIYQDEEGRFGFYRNDSMRVEVPAISLSEQEFEQVKSTIVQPYRYVKGEPLYHVGIYRTQEADYLFVDVGHAVSDGMTMTILFQDIERLYAGERVPKERYTYFDFVLDEQERNRRGRRERDIRYFMRQMDGLRITKSILTRPDSGNLGKGDFAVLRGRMATLSREQIRSFCKRAGVSDNILFNAAFNYTVSLFRNEHDSVCCTIHSGRTDGRWAHLAGPLFMSCLFRFEEMPGETVPDALRRLAAQNRETLKCFVSNLKSDEMFFQYQGDFLRMNRHADIWAGSVPLQLDSQSFHLQIIADDECFSFEQRYWRNRFDADQLRVFLRVLEAVALAMTCVERVADIRSQLPQTVLPKNPTFEGGLAKVVNDEGLEQPIGGWGHLMVPSGTVWQDSGRLARVLPSGRVDLLQDHGRTIMVEGLRGREYVDLAVLEGRLLALDGVREVRCYVGYRPDNTMNVFAEVNGSQLWDRERIECELGQTV